MLRVNTGKHMTSLESAERTPINTANSTPTRWITRAGGLLFIIAAPIAATRVAAASVDDEYTYRDIKQTLGSVPELSCT